MKKKILEIKEQVIRECEESNGGKTLCNKEFFTLVREGDKMVIKDCECRRKLDRRVKCFVAGIEKPFWDFEWNDIDGIDKKTLDEFDKFRNNVESCVDNKYRFFFTGKYGNGKTLVASLLLKDVLSKGYSGYILKASNLLKYIYSRDEDDEDMMDKIDSADFLIVDEIDKLNGREKAINDACDRIDTYMLNKCIILISNLNIKELSNNNYPQYFIDRLKNSKIITFKGNSYRDVVGNAYDNFEGE